MERRTFIKSSIVSSVGISGFGSILLFASGKEVDEDFILPKYDLIVCGGTLHGCLSAIQASKRGLRVLLLEERSYLGAEITAKFRPWLRKEGYENLSGELLDIILPEAEKAEVGVSIQPDTHNSVFYDEIPLFCGSIKKQLMAVLMKRNVHVLLMTGNWGIVGDRDRQCASGVVLANKFGLQIVRGSNIIDARIHRNESAVEHSFVLEFHGVSGSVDRHISVSEDLGFINDSIELHKGKRKPGQYFVEFWFNAALANAENMARIFSEKLSAYLIGNHPDFSKASLVHLAYETGQHGMVLDQEKASSFYNVEYLSPGNGIISSCSDLYKVHTCASQLVEMIPFHVCPEDNREYIHHSSGSISLSDCQISSIDDIRLHHAIQNISFSLERFISVKLEAELLVAGGGTAGAMVSKAALERGVKVATIEYFPDLGGTKTMGGVIGYYWGYEAAESFIEGENERALLRTRMGKESSIPAFKMYLRKSVLKNNGQLLTNSIVCDALMDGITVIGLLVFHEEKLHLIKGALTIDATGDGDIAVFAGAKFEFGDTRTNCTQNYSQWDFKSGLVQWADSTESRDYDIIQNHYLSELQRAFQLSHSQSKYYDFSSMLTVRESRRIHGEYTITLKDIVEDKHHNDVLCVAKSDYDPHHFGDNIYTRVGCLVPHAYEALVEIPYRSLIPRGINNLLVSAKAISQSQIALQFTRMSMDVLNLGYATGIVAAAIIQKDTNTRDIDLEPIQEELKSLKIIPPERMKLPLEPDYSNYMLDQQIRSLMEGGTNSLFRVLFLPERKVLPLLKTAYASEIDDVKKTNIARALAWFACSDGNALLIKEMEGLAHREQRENFQPKEYYRLDKDSDYWTINQDIMLLALSGDKAVLKSIIGVSEKMKLNNPPVQQHRVYDRGRIDLGLIPFYNRILNICYAVDLLPDNMAKAQLSRFLDDLYLRDHQTTEDPLNAGKNVYGAILESRVAASLASLGEKRGFLILVKYLLDVHTMLALYAHRELCRLSKNDFGFDQERWNAYFMK